MHLWLIRHGDCESFAADPAGPALTLGGLKDIEKMAAHLGLEPQRPERLFCSPLLRARQSAIPFAAQWSLAPEIVDWLLPESNPAKILNELQGLKGDSLALVGHMPSLGLLLSVLTQGLPAREALLPRAGAALLRAKAWEPGASHIEWFHSPEDSQ